MVHFRFWPTAAAGVAVLATTAIAFAGPTPAATVVRHPVPVVVRRPVTVPVARPVAIRRVDNDVADDALLARINRIDRENCALAMRERADFAPAILTGIIEQRQAECMRQRFNPRPFTGGFRDADDRRSFDADDHRFDNRRSFDADDHRFDNRRSFDADDRRIGALRTDDRRDDRQISRLRTDDRRDNRQINRLRTDRDDQRTPMRFATAVRVQNARRTDRPMGRPHP